MKKAPPVLLANVFFVGFLFVAYAPAVKAQTQLLKLHAPDSGQKIGKNVAGGGDVTGDGVPDFIVATYLNPKIACVFSGANGAHIYDINDPGISGVGIGPAGVWTTISVAPAGDFDHDGTPDWIMGIPDQEDYFGDIAGSVVVGSGNGNILQSYYYFFNSAVGTAVAGIGDVNADGFDDIIFSQGWGPTAQGFIARGGPSGTPLFSVNNMNLLGTELAPARDINLDGIPDFLVTTPAQARSGADGSVLFTFSAANSIASAGDINSDGYPDILSGSTTGNVTIYSGISGGVLLNVTGSTSLFGYSVASLGDINNDNVPDFIVGNPGDGTAGQNAGAAFVYSGSNAALLFTILGGAAGEELGRSVGGAGDLNQDGIPDALLLAPGRKELPPYAGANYISAVSFAPGLSQSGAGTPGCDGVHIVNCNKVPKPNTPNFAITTTNAPPLSLGLGLITDIALPAGGDLLGIQLTFYLDLFNSTELITFDPVSDGYGFGVGPIPIPNDPLFSGLTRFVQTIWYWGGGPCAPSTLALSSSMLLTVTVQ